HQLALFGQRIARMLSFQLFELGDGGLVILAVDIVQRALIKRGCRNDRLFLDFDGSEQTAACAGGQHGSKQADKGKPDGPARQLAHNVKLHKLPRSLSSAWE